jgi:broad specificity phosphatase PhoE
MQGKTDIALNDLGRQQALSLQKFFAQNPIERVYSSDLDRAHETARIATATSAVPIVLDARLRETNLGDVEGLTREQLLAKFGEISWEKWRSLAPEDQHFSFPNGETRVQHVERLFAALHSIVQDGDWQRIGISTHGGSIRRIVHHIKPDLNESVMVGNCVVYELGFDLMSGTWRVEAEPRFVPDAF